MRAAIKDGYQEGLEKSNVKACEPVNMTKYQKNMSKIAYL